MIGTGSTCTTIQTAASCTQIAVQNEAVVGQPNDQGNIVPVGGTWSLNSSDTGGMTWDASLGGGLFTKLVFAIRDASDQKTTWTVATADGTSESFSSEKNGNLKLITIDFESAVTSSTITLASTQNDAFTIDGAAMSRRFRCRQPACCSSAASAPSAPCAPARRPLPDTKTGPARRDRSIRTPAFARGCFRS